MIVAFLSDPQLGAAVRLAGHPEEDVILERDLASRAIEWGYPRVVLHAVSEADAPTTLQTTRSVRITSVTGAMLARWEVERRRERVPVGRVDFLAARLRELLETGSSPPTWVDRALGDLGRAAGAPLPLALRSFARRILEFPSHYRDLHPLAESCGLSRGALKARFRRRHLSSPYTYLRWLRLIASANVLSDRSVTVAQAARRIGFTSDGNLCRSMQSLGGLTTTEARTPTGWNQLLLTFARDYLGREALDGWREMDELFVVHLAA